MFLFLFSYLMAMGHTRQSSSKAPLWNRTVYSLLTQVPSGNISKGQFFTLFTCWRIRLLTIKRSRDSLRSNRMESVNGLSWKLPQIIKNEPGVTNRNGLKLKISKMATLNWKCDILSLVGAGNTFRIHPNQICIKYKNLNIIQLYLYL